MPKIQFESDWLKANINVKQGDFIRFLDEGHQDEKGQWVFKVGVVEDGKVVRTKKFSLNKKNFNAIVRAFGSDDSDEWVGKEIKVTVVQVENPKTGELVSAVRLVSPVSPDAGEQEE